MTPESRDGTMLHPGSVGVDITLEQAQEAAVTRRSTPSA